MNKSCLRCGCFVALLIAGQISVGACLAEQGSATRDKARLAAAQQAALNDDFKRLQALEPRALAAADADAEREGDRLVLHLRSGAQKEYVNSPKCGEPSEEARCQLYVLIAHAHWSRAFVVAQLQYESSKYLLVDDGSGVETTLSRFPDFSPSGERVLERISADDRVGFAVQLWRREGDRFVLEWSASPHTDGVYTSYDLVRWRSEDIIELRAKTTFLPPRPFAIRHFELRHSADGWKVVETS
jgi:hypothetical protein